MIAMRIDTELKLGFKDVLIRPKRSKLQTRQEVELQRTYTFKHSGFQWSGIPIMAANMDTVGTFEMANALACNGLLTMLHKHYSLEQWSAFLKSNAHLLPNSIGVSTGISELDFQKTKNILELDSRIQFICLDVANGYSEYFVKAVEKMRNLFPNKTIIAGNVVTGEMVEQLILSGADIIKIGIGPGSVCTTRVKTGIGYPQLSAVIECSDAAHGLGGHVISDGGHTIPGDIAKSFGGGADFVMLGGMLAGHQECMGEVLADTDGKKFMEFYGMSSATAMEKHANGVAEYRASEGKCVKIPYKGAVLDTIKDILGALRSTCTYVGASQLKELSKRTTFIRTLEQENRIYT